MRGWYLRLAGVALCLSMCLAGAGQAVAHAALVQAEPADGAVLQQAPAVARLRFNEPVSVTVIRLIDALGRTHDALPTQADGDAILVKLPVPLPGGSQLLSYRVVSADGHPVGGALVFSIGAPSRTSGAVASDPVLASLIWISRLGIYLGLFGGIGGVAFAGWVARRPAERLTTAVLLGLGAGAAMLSLGLQGLDLSGAGWAGLADLGNWRLAADGSFGVSMLATLIALALAAAALHWPGAIRLLSAMALAGVGISLAVTGHASAASPQFLTRPAVFVHAVGVAYWLGALLPLLLMLRRGDPELPAILARFSAGAMVAVAALAAAGVSLAIIQVGAFPALVTTHYGQILSFKLLAVLVLLGLAALNRWWLTPRLGSGGDKALARSVLAEIVVAIAILGLVAGWRFTPPPRALAAAAVSPVAVQLRGERAVAALTFQHGDGGATLTISLKNAALAPLAAQEVGVALSLPSAGIEPVLRVAERHADGWQVKGLTLPRVGPWHIRITALVDDFDEITVEGEVPVR